MPDLAVPEYTVLAVLSAVVTVLLERRLRTGLFRSTQYWTALGIVLFFMVLVDGWLTKLSAPIVVYNPDHHSGLRLPWDIPVEDYLFGFSMITLSIILWQRAKAGRADVSAPDDARTRSSS